MESEIELNLDLEQRKEDLRLKIAQGMQMFLVDFFIYCADCYNFKLKEVALFPEK